jgi:hypothetical protein
MQRGGDAMEEEANIDVARDLIFLESYRAMRATFFAAVLDAACTDEPDALHMLRQESLFQLAEFLFALKSHGIATQQSILTLARLHNDHLMALRDDRGRMRRFGLTEDRIEAALFTAENTDKLLANFTNQNNAFDQSDLARFLVTVMSAETCRKLVVAAERAGLVKRWRSPYGAVLVRSEGVLEEIFSRSLREARRGTETL